VATTSKEQPVVPPSEVKRRTGVGVGSAIKEASGRRLSLGVVTKSEAPKGRATPIQMPTIGPTVQPIGPARTSAEIPAPVRAPAGRAALRRRHRLAFYSFILLVILPTLVVAGYLFAFAQDQFASEAGFSVRKEEGPSSMDMIGGLTQLTGSASTDAEILYDYIRSPDLVAQLHKDLDLFAIYGRNYEGDPLFSLKPDATIEEKRAYWQRMVKVEYNEATGLIGLQVRAFTPEEAQKVGQAIIGYSSFMINRLTEVAREDSTRYARAELARAVDRLKEVRAALTKYRSDNQVVDPLSDIQGQMGLMNKLEEQLAQAMIELDILRDFARPDDVRAQQQERRIEVIQKRLAEERLKFGIGIDGKSNSNDYAQTVAEYERLVVDREVAEEAFRSATMILDQALAEANRKSRYLAAHVEPTLAEGAVYPQFTLILAMTAFFLTLVWALGTLIFYSIRDRR
jgi:capsular polysaccharide transport system permease protein